MERLKEVYDKFYENYPLFGRINAFDVETTGLQTDARLIEIGCISIHFDGLETKIESYQTLINPGFSIIPKITEITGITNEELRQAPGEDVYQNFVNWLEQRKADCCIAHNARFDEGKIRANLSRVGLSIHLPKFECTMELAKKTVKLDDYKLNTVAEHCMFTNARAHRALQDTVTCAYIFAKLKLMNK